MPGASTSASSSGGNGGGHTGAGTKRRASESVAVGAGGSTHFNSSGRVMNAGSGSASGFAATPTGRSHGHHGNGIAKDVDFEDGASNGSNAKPDSNQQNVAVMKMKAEVFEKDRDNFLSAYEKPTQIYRYLRARGVQGPVFMQRNLSYMKSRMSRSHTSRQGFKIDKILENVMRRQPKRELEVESDCDAVVSCFSKYTDSAILMGFGGGKPMYYNVIITGATDGQVWQPDTYGSLDICLAKNMQRKRKDGPGPVQKVTENRVNVLMHSPSNSTIAHNVCIPEPHSKCQVISIPADKCSPGKNGHTVQSYTLALRLIIPRARLQQSIKSEPEHQSTNRLNSRNISSANDHLEEPKVKRRRSLPSKDRENFIYDKNNKGGEHDDVVYTGTISIFEKDSNEDMIKEADFECQLKRAIRGKNGISHQRIRREVSWASFHEKHSKLQEQAKPEGKSAKVTLQVRISDKKLPEFIDPSPPLLSAHVKREEGADDDSLAKQEMRNSVRVIYQFMYGSSSQQQTESRDNFLCPWCSLNCMQLYSLLKHLKLCHPRYHFVFSPIPNGAKIDVTINDSYDGSYSGSAFDLVSQPPGEAFARNGPTKRTEVFAILVCRPKQIKTQSLQEFFDCDEKDVDQRRTYITGHNRLYHHTSTCLPIHPREIDVDSEGEPDPEWLRVKTTMMIDEFTDVNEGEKELMKLWNLHVMKLNYVGDCQIPVACRRFVELHGKDLIEKNLYRNFCLHVTNLFDFGLLTPHGVHSTIESLHSQMNEANAKLLKEFWKRNCGVNLSQRPIAEDEIPKKRAKWS